MMTTLTIHKDSFDMIVKDGAFGSMQKSKILNYVFWKSDNAYDPVAMISQFFQQPNLFECKSSLQPTLRVTDSVLDKLDKHEVWKCLSVPSAEEDGCEYCTMQPVGRQLFPKHQIYTNGKLTCPLLLRSETAKYLDTPRTYSKAIDKSERVVKKRYFKGGK